MTLTNNPPGTSDTLVVQSSVGSLGDTIKVWRDATFTSLIGSGPASAGLTVSLEDNFKTDAGWTGLSAVYVSVVDGVGNQSSPAAVAIDYVADFQPPAQPSPPAIDASQFVTVSALPTTSLTRPTFVGPAGAVEAGVRVTLYEGTTVIGSAMSSETSGAFSIAPSVDLADGSHSVTIEATDLAGNVSVP
jgi:hypothetical protein